MSDPTAESLHDSLAVLVGDPRPSVDLAARARHRGTKLRHQRLAGGLTAVAVAGAICVPALALVRDRAGGGAVGAGSGGGSKAADTATVDKAKSSVLSGGAKHTTSIGPTSATTILPGKLDATDKARVAAAKALLGNGFTLQRTDIAVDTTTRVHRGAAASFKATAGGGVVAVEWSTGPHSTTGSASVGGKHAVAGEAEQASGAILVRGDTEWDVKVLPGSASSAPIFGSREAVQSFLTRLADASS